jgi:hypothetical protein
MSDAEEPAECLPLDDVDLIRPLLDDFRSAKRGARKDIVRKAVTMIMAAKDISHLRPLAQGKLIAKVKEVLIQITHRPVFHEADTLNSKQRLGSTIMDAIASRKMLLNTCGDGIYGR